MVRRKRTTRKKTPSWNRLGGMIGRKVEREFKNKPREKDWMCYSHSEGKGGGFGRLLFIIALLFILNTKGYLVGVSSWILVLLVIGFAMMRL